MHNHCHSADQPLFSNCVFIPFFSHSPKWLFQSFSFLLRSPPQSSPVADDPALYCFEEMETIRRVVLPSSYCLLCTSAQIHAAFLPVHLGEISVLPARPISLLVKACPFVHSRNLLQQFSAFFRRISFPSPGDHSRWCTRMLLLFHHKSPSLTPSCSIVSNVLVPALLDPLAHECIVCALHAALTYALFGVLYYIFLSSSFLFLNWPE